ncbi:flagellar protein FlaG [Polaromonas sp. CT11-55]|uniref:flagellar protein FlaG n=1 Tax=Polaromonas sp. CT11-55 TaxID=3243045 RepID=UPI0039A68E43
MTISANAAMTATGATAAAWRDAAPPPPVPSARAGASRDVPAETGPRAEPERERERSALAEINESLRMSSIGVQFEFDKEADTMVVKVVDVESGELIRQMPSEEVVRISRALGKLQGLLVHQAV